MSMTSETIIQECQGTDDSKIPKIKYDFVSIGDIPRMEPDSLIGKLIECSYLVNYVWG